ncbi:hypothetical protein evm_007919 [Chilo suppressalis]|nr:hypothetical protein evm_007919 [Chilo suppressalis]
MIELVKVSDNQKVVGTMRDIGADSFVCRVQYLNDLDPFSEYNVREPSRPLYHTFNTTIPLSYQIAAVHRLLQAPHRLDDATLQVFKDGDYGPYLDLDSTLGEQDEELEGLQDNRKNTLVLRTQLPVRVHAIIEKLLHSQGRELRRALFSLKQILQSDKDLVHDFVANKGLDCLMQVGNMEDHNYIDYILRALGQILLYVDGMHGVMSHNRCVQWLYSLISSKFRHVVKTALKLLVIFVEYTQKNSLHLIEAINAVDSANGRPPWYNIMKILQDFDASDTELLIYATTLINICLNNIPDRDTYYDQVDVLQDQGMDEIIQLYMTKQGTDLDLLRQLQVFEAVLLYEDGDETGTALKQLDESVVSSVRRRSLNLNSSERRKSKKQQSKEKVKSSTVAHTEPRNKIINNIRPQLPLDNNKELKKNKINNNRPQLSLDNNKDNKELSSALKRRRDRFARQAHHIIQQQELLNNSNEIYDGLFGNTNGNYSPIKNNVTTPNTDLINGTYTNSNNNYVMNINGNNDDDFGINGVNGHDDGDIYLNRTMKSLNLPDVLKNGNQKYTSGLKQRIQNGTLGHSVNAVDALTASRQKQGETTPEIKDDRGILLNREHSIKDLAQRLISPVCTINEEKPLRVAEMTGIVSKAKEELAKSQSKGDLLAYVTYIWGEAIDKRGESLAISLNIAKALIGFLDTVCLLSSAPEWLTSCMSFMSVNAGVSQDSVETKEKRENLVIELNQDLDCISECGTKNLIEFIAQKAQYGDPLDRLQRRAIRIIVDKEVTKHLEPRQLRRDVAILSAFYRLYLGACFEELLSLNLPSSFLQKSTRAGLLAILQAGKMRIAGVASNTAVPAIFASRLLRHLTSDIPKTKPSDFLKVIAEFALEYRTTRERVLQQLEKRANHRERNKTRGKMIIDSNAELNAEGIANRRNAHPPAHLVTLQNILIFTSAQ